MTSGRTARIYPDLGLAVLFPPDGDGALELLSADDWTTPHPIQRRDLAQLWHSLSFETTGSLENIGQTLDRYSRAENGWYFAQNALRAQIPPERRARSLERLNKRLSEIPQTKGCIAWSLLSNGPPPIEGVEEAREIAEEKDFSHASSVVERICTQYDSFAAAAPLWQKLRPWPRPAADCTTAWPNAHDIPAWWDLADIVVRHFGGSEDAAFLFYRFSQDAQSSTCGALLKDHETQLEEMFADTLKTGALMASQEQDESWEDEHLVRRLSSPPPPQRRKKGGLKEDVPKEAALSWKDRLRDWPTMPAEFADLPDIQRQIDEAITHLHDALFWERLESLVSRQYRCSRLKDVAKSLCQIAAAAANQHVYPVAEELLLPLLDAVPQDATVVTQYAELRRRTGDLIAAEAVYRDAIKRFPNEPFPYTGLAETLRQAGQIDSAQETYRDAIKRFPNEPVPYTGLAETLRQAGQIDSAQETYRDAIKRFPTNPVPCNGLAETLRQAGQIDRAQETYRDTIKRFPHDRIARNGLAALLSSQGRWEEAAALVQVTTPRTHGEWIAYHIGAMILLRQGQSAEAIQRFRHGISACPFSSENPYFKSALATALLRQGDYKQARDTVITLSEVRVKAKASDLCVASLMAHAEAGLGDTILARQHLEKARTLAPESAIILKFTTLLERRFPSLAGGQSTLDSHAISAQDAELFELELQLLAESHLQEHQAA
jgi:Flp pilus assembly protein TadD